MGTGGQRGSGDSSKSHCFQSGKVLAWTDYFLTTWMDTWWKSEEVDKYGDCAGYDIIDVQKLIKI